MKLGYFDCPTGISGDMILGALVDCGVPIALLNESLAGVPIEGYQISEKRVNKHGLSAIQVEVQVNDNVKERRLSEILSIVEDSHISEQVKEKALGVFKRIGAVESNIHGVDAESIHLHELGGVDTVIDVIGAFVGMEILELNAIYASALPLATGTITTAHGTLPLPAPATLELLQGVPVRGSEVQRELVTPTGAAILTAMVKEFGTIPPMRLLKTGYGAGKMDLPVPNVLRLLVGEVKDFDQTDIFLREEQLICLETNIDNMNPEIYSYLMERLFEVGALDVSLIPVYMKKNRPGTLVNVLCSEENTDAILKILFSETKTLGARKYIVQRYSVERQIAVVATPYGDVQVKFSRKGNHSWEYAAEFEDCRKIALEKHLPIMQIYRAAEHAAEEYLSNHQEL